jgi:hypothetical protein
MFLDPETGTKKKMLKIGRIEMQNNRTFDLDKQNLFFWAKLSPLSEKDPDKCFGGEVEVEE